MRALGIDVAPERGRAVVRLRGDLDLATAPSVEDEVRGLYERGVSSVVLDLRDLAFMDSSGLRLLLRIDEHASTAERSFAIAGATSGPAFRLLELTRMSGHFQTADV